METLSRKRDEKDIGCPSTDIAAYIDGELSLRDELMLETHIAGCGTCTDELNAQKQLIIALNGSLSSTPELPTDFTKRIVANAESGVSGLRHRKERSSALFVCAALFFFVIFTLGANAPGAIAAFFDAATGAAAVAGFGAHLLYDVSIGGVIILRSFAAQPAFAPLSIVLIAPIIAGLVYRNSHIRSSRQKLDQLESGSGI